MELTTNNVEHAVQRQLDVFLRSALPQAVTVSRRVIPDVPDSDRVTILPGEQPAIAEVMFLGGSDRAIRDEEFTVTVWVEVVDVDQDRLEDRLDDWLSVVEDIAAEHPRLGDMAGVTMFAVTGERNMRPVVEMAGGVLYQWVETSFSVRARYQ